MATKNPIIILVKIIGILVASVLTIAILVLMGLNLFKFAYYNDYFSALTKCGKNPGLDAGFVPQGITYFDGLNISVGYMDDHSRSRLYTVDYETGEQKVFFLNAEGKPFDGHTGGIQYLDGYFYLANEGNSLYKFSSALIYQASETIIDIGSPIKLNSNTSFVYGKDNFLYVGEFHKSEAYPCTNEISFNDKTHYAIVEKYDISDLTKPVTIYSIPEMIQGFCIKDDGTIVLSSSWSVNSSNFYIYEPSQIVKTGETYKGAEVYFLTEPSKTVKAPAMSEDLDIIKAENGTEKVITLFESACNKYFYGKFFFANYIAALDF